jgi:hypothetical protein
MMKVNINNAYRIVPIHPDDFDTSWIQINDRYYYFTYGSGLFLRIV